MSLYSETDFPFVSAMKRGRNMMIALGVLMIIAGLAAILFPVVSTLGVNLCVGVMLMFAGIVQGIGAFSYHGRAAVGAGLFIGALWLLGGIYLLAWPQEGVFTLTVLVAAVFVIEGLIKAFVSFQMRPLGGWGWVLFSGGVSFALGAMLWWQLPSSALWALGTLAGINIMISGWTLVMVPLAIGRLFDAGWND